MAQKITIELPDDLYQSAHEAAVRAGLDLEAWLIRQTGYAAPTPEMRRSSLEWLMKHAGAATPPDADNSHNEQIDRDLAEEYASTHNEQA
ncbi:MAG: hypothetical protein M3552_05970 [Planctomycetota bacterium]|nr:hypothetical protein [Planctomycetaceae bacterium]MDQ3330185.1 hypothetical protein [Planctomycetota bacterium]